MNLVRSIISVFLVILLSISIAGWMWAGGLPGDKMIGARAVLGVCGLAATVALVLLWRAKQPQAA